MATLMMIVVMTMLLLMFGCCGAVASVVLLCCCSCCRCCCCSCPGFCCCCCCRCCCGWSYVFFTGVSGIRVGQPLTTNSAILLCGYAFEGLVSIGLCGCFGKDDLGKDVSSVFFLQFKGLGCGALASYGPGLEGSLGFTELRV